MDTTRRLSCLIAGFYGVGFGVFSLPTALFVGPQNLISSLGHIAVGSGFLLAATAIRRNRLWGDVLMLICSMFSGAIGVIAATSSAIGDELNALIFWVPFCAFFAWLSGMTLYELCWRARRA